MLACLSGHAILAGMTEKRPRRPRDPNQLAKRIVDLATGEASEDSDPPKPADSDKNPHAVELGRLGGKRGGRARAEALSPEKRSEIARRAARRRWNKEC
jgi:hypothetical protein